MYSGTITVDLGGMSDIADCGREALGVRPGDTPGVEGFGFLFWRMRRNSLKRPIVWSVGRSVGPKRRSLREGTEDTNSKVRCG